MKKTDSKAGRQPANACQCHGFTLIEMLAVMAVMSIMFTAAVTTLAFLMRVEIQGTERIQNHLILQKLSHQFREDVKASQDAVIVKQEQLKLNQGNNSKIVYLPSESGNTIHREVRKGEKIVLHEEYQLLLTDMKFEIEEMDQQELVSLELQILEKTNHENQTLAPFFRVFRCESYLNHNNQILNRLKRSTPDSK